MSDKKPTNGGSGRSSLLEMMRRREERRRQEEGLAHHSVETPSQTSSDPQTKSHEGHSQSSDGGTLPPPVASVGRGRAQLASMLKLHSSSSSSGTESRELPALGHGAVGHGAVGHGAIRKDIAGHGATIGRGSLLGLLQKKG